MKKKAFTRYFYLSIYVQGKLIAVAYLHIANTHQKHFSYAQILQKPSWFVSFKGRLHSESNTQLQPGKEGFRELSITEDVFLQSNIWEKFLKLFQTSGKENQNSLPHYRPDFTGIPA